MRILYLSQRYFPHEKGGAAISLRILAENMARKHEVAVFTVDTKNTTEIVNHVLVIRRQVPKLSKMLYETAKRQKRKLKSILVRLSMILDLYHEEFIKILENELDNFKPQIVHLNNVVGFPLKKIYRILKRRRIKIIQSVHDSFLLGILGISSSGFPIPFWYQYTNNVLSKCDIVHFPSKTIMEKFGKKISTRKVVIPNTVGRDFEEELWEELVSKKKKELPKKMIFAGTLSKYKGVHLLASCYKDLYKDLGENLQLIFVGDGPARNFLETDLENFIKSGKVKITGWIPFEEVEKFFKEAHFVVLPSQVQETFGRVLVEGFYNGCLPIGSSWGAIPEVIGDNSLIFDNYEQLLAIIRYYYNEGVWFKKMYELKENMKKFSLSNHIMRFEKLYRELLK
ncbi:hypothetical protein AS005_06225 [Thermotoga sp. KOL6]|nr:glycosyltransferase family 4 protein [Thermotoga sp. KOL6]PLV59333.1 hypothetical protein AS005_06225 [Thermotoga sp. KOL6]